MKIVHLVLSNVFAGIEQHVNELALDLEHVTDIEVCIICNKEIAPKFKNTNIKTINNFSRRSPFGLIKLLIMIKKIQPDIVHTHGSKTTAIINIIKHFTNIKHIATAHGIKNKTSVYKNATKLIAVSHLAKKSIDAPSIVINNWYSPYIEDKKSKEGKYILAVGRLEKVKGFDLLVQSWVNIEENLIIVGSGKEYDSLINLINTHELSNKIQIINEVSQEELMHYYKNASMLVISSRNEGGPRVALEALYQEIPVISTRVGHMPEILPDELLAEPDSLESLRGLIQTHVGNNNYLQDSIFQYVKEEFSLRGQSKKILDIYKNLFVSQ
ncbi:glycosyltransferase family 4 protein [Gammaproteobacteria bacterium]|jgi:glycosyltransferase involved in cell wall biosynthesis|nr:glycosyltransferase family 4 protein [Gammaproteobacteria bacterium]MDB2451433.1 glycosyltransferase family 4 protein [Gammaproteobacteria bacterium]MDB2503930.1 glycosyltransferase family 4 protein [Gammaproteobacteria bacterium]